MNKHRIPYDAGKRHPRTMQEAFGPYTSNKIHDPDRDLSKEDLMAAACGFGVFVVVMILLYVSFAK